MSDHNTAVNTWTAPHGGWVRRDVADVPPLGAYPARQCPVRAQGDVLQPADPEPVPEFVAELGRAGVTFETDVFEQLAGLHPDAVQIDAGLPLDDQQAATMAAVTAGAPLILGGRLPVDEVGRRVAHPDVLVRTRTAGDGWRYLPVDVKHHGTLTEASKGADVVVQPLDGLQAPTDSDDPALVGRRDTGTNRKDLLHLAHYWRTLDAHGLAPDEAPWGGVLGSERQVAWYRLDEPRWCTPSATSATGTRTRTTLEVYDFEFGFRLDIVATAMAHQQDPTVALLVDPVWIDECSSCPWRGHCRAILEDREDVSLLPRIGWSAWSALREVGATTMPALAALPDETTIAGMRAPALAHAIEEARARIGPDVAYRRRVVDQIVVPRADIEVDVDMENVAGGAYLWGCLVTDRTHARMTEPGYRGFVSWNPDEQAAGLEAFAAFWEWLQDLRDRCDHAGVRLAAYCWHAPAENRWLRAASDQTGQRDEVDQFTDSDDWIDLRRVFADQVVTGHAAGLKDVATLLGFRWRDDTPGGDQSMLWWQQAVDPASPDDQRTELRQRLLDYNEDDVCATLHVRDWLDTHATSLQATR